MQRALTPRPASAILATMTLPRDLTTRRLEEGDSLAELTDLLHRAYARHAARGLHFVATHQDVATTAKRVANGETFVCTLDGRLVATVTLRPPSIETGCPWYERRDVAVLTQLAVDPALGRLGIGSMLVERCAARAGELGMAELALDTSEHAEDLIAYYTSRGFRLVDRADWRPHVNYRSVVMSRALAPARSEGA